MRANSADIHNGIPVNEYPLNTIQFAAYNQVVAQTVRKRLCETGSYFGVVPKKLRNSRLAWPAIQVA